MDILGKKLLQGERIFLGPISEDDMGTYAHWFSDVELLRLTWTENIVPQSEASERHRFQTHKDKDEYGFNIRLRADDKLIGNVTIKPPDWRSRWAEIGITIGEKAYRSQGYGVEALNVALRYAFYELNLNRIELETPAYNEQALRAYKKTGFTQEVVKRQALYRDGVYYDLIIMSILKDEWLARQPSDDEEASNE